MTTDAPPEKMTNAQIANEAENLARDHDNEFPITARILREAAHRLTHRAKAEILLQRFADLPEERKGYQWRPGKLDKLIRQSRRLLQRGVHT